MTEFGSLYSRKLNSKLSKCRRWDLTAKTEVTACVSLHHYTTTPESDNTIGVRQLSYMVKKLCEIPRLVKTCCFHRSCHHPSCSLAFQMHRLSRPFPSVTMSLPLSIDIPVQREGADRLHRSAGWAVSAGVTLEVEFVRDWSGTHRRPQETVVGHCSSDVFVLPNVNSMFIIFSLYFVFLSWEYLSFSPSALYIQLRQVQTATQR